MQVNEENQIAGQVQVNAVTGKLDSAQNQLFGFRVIGQLDFSAIKQRSFGGNRPTLLAEGVALGSREEESV
jgi:hypothetical protein